MNALELYKGTGSFGKEAKKLGFNVISLDINPKSNATITTDILKWNYKELKDVPISFIWASPPCETYSVWNYSTRKEERDVNDATPYSERAKLGTKILYQTLKIINYFRKLNPKMGFCIENIRGMMRKDKRMLRLPFRGTTSYNQYGFDRIYKPTDFWTNFPLFLYPVKKPKNIERIKDIPLNERFKIPPDLITHILTTYLNNA